MTLEIRVPDLNGIFATAKVSRWLKQVGDHAEGDEPLLMLETEEFMLEMPALEDGVLTEIIAQEGDIVEVGSLLGYLQPSLSE